MNDLMTKSFLNYVDLKKQAMKDLDSEPDIEMGQLNPADEHNLSQFFEEVSAIKTDMEEITNLLLSLQDLNQDTKSTHSAKVLRGLRDRINSDMVTVLRKAKIIKTKLEALDRSNVANRSMYKEGTPIDRTRISVTNGLRIKLKDVMNDFQSLRDVIVRDHKEGLKKRYFNAYGENPSEEMVEKMVLGSVEAKFFEGKTDLVMENKERHEAVKEIQKSLKELHQVFLDMAVLVETQGDHMDNIEDNVVRAGAYVNGGTKGLADAKQLKNQRKKWAFWVGVILMILLFVCLVAFWV